MRQTILTATMLICAAAAAAAGTRSEIPIREVVLGDQARRYTIPITVGGTPIEAGLDTGSAGLRILPGTLKASDATADGSSDMESYGSGARVTGMAGHAQVTIGALGAPITVQLIDKVDCVSRLPNCPASRIGIDKYGLQGDGLPGEGFRAIIGVNMAEVEIARPLYAIGATRWIVELPRPGIPSPGKLVLNPSDDEVKDFVMLPLTAAFRQKKGGLHDAVAGCLINAGSKEKACGAVLMDSGAPGIRLANGGLDTEWKNGTQAALGFYDAGGLRATETFTVGMRQQASRLSFTKEEEPRATVIYAGLSPYFAFDVLYDPAAGMIGLKPRPEEPGTPIGELAAPRN